MHPRYWALLLCRSTGSCCSYSHALFAGSCRCNSGFSGPACELSELGVTLDQVYTGTVAQGAWNYFFYSPRSIYSELDWIVTQTSTQGDCDIYLRAYNRPTLWEWDLANVTIGPVSIINQTEVTQGTTYYLGVYGYTGCQYNIKVVGVTPSSSSECPNQCSLHSTSCVRSKCTCMAGFTGVVCETMTYNLPLDYPVPGYVGDNAWNYCSPISVFSIPFLFLFFSMPFFPFFFQPSLILSFFSSPANL